MPKASCHQRKLSRHKWAQIFFRDKSEMQRMLRPDRGRSMPHREIQTKGDMEEMVDRIANPEEEIIFAPSTPGAMIEIDLARHIGNDNPDHKEEVTDPTRKLGDSP